MSILSKRLPTSLQINGKDYKINTDYRCGIEFEQILNDGALDNNKKLIQILKLYLGDVPPVEDISSAVDQILWFYRCGKLAPEGTKRKKKERPQFSFEHDANYIYAAFLQQYKLDILSTPLHWWTFRALFDALSDETELRKIIGYRAIKIDDKMTKSQKEFYRTMKKIYALPLDKDDAERLRRVEQMLMTDGVIKE